MNEESTDLFSAQMNPAGTGHIAERIFAPAQPGVVFSEPIRQGDFTVITASEVAAGGGFGAGGGTGPVKTRRRQEQGEGEPGPMVMGSGSGSGGGGGSTGRPVAVIVIGPDGVEVKPVVDATKIGLALITALGAMLLMGRSMRRLAKR